jgi:hypothetical protein
MRDVQPVGDLPVIGGGARRRAGGSSYSPRLRWKMSARRAKFSGHGGKHQRARAGNRRRRGREPTGSAGIIYVSGEASGGHYRHISIRGRVSSLTAGGEGNVSQAWTHHHPTKTNNHHQFVHGPTQTDRMGRHFGSARWGCPHTTDAPYGEFPP